MASDIKSVCCNFMVAILLLQMKLDQNTQKFAKEVEKAEISGNLDAPEGGFDAIVQAIACNVSSDFMMIIDVSHRQLSIDT